MGIEYPSIADLVGEAENPIVLFLVLWLDLRVWLAAPTICAEG